MACCSMDRMSSSPVLVLDIDGVVSLAQPGWPRRGTPRCRRTRARLRRDGARLLPQATGCEVLRGRLDLYVALHEYLETKGLADRLEEFVAYWFEKDAVIDRERAGRWPTPGASAPAGACSPPPTRSITASPTCATRPGSGAHFDEIIYSAALGVCKPDRVFFTNAQARMGVTRRAVDPVRRRQRRQCRRRAHGRLAGDALPRTATASAARWRDGAEAC